MAYQHKTAHRGNNNTNNRKGNKFNKKKPEGPQILLGDYQYNMNDKEIVIKIQSEDFPFPNSIVFQNERPVGKVDEVFGKLEESYASILIDSKFDKQTPFFCNKFLKREWLLPRTEALGEKEKKDKKKGSQTINKESDKFNRKEDRFNKGNINRDKNFKGGFNKDRNNSNSKNFKRNDKPKENWKPKIVKFDD